jgi:hypothetical protein
MLSFWGLFRGKRTWISREDQGTCILSQANDCGRVASPMAHLFVSSLPGTMTLDQSNVWTSSDYIVMNKGP